METNFAATETVEDLRARVLLLKLDILQKEQIYKKELFKKKLSILKWNKRLNKEYYKQMTKPSVNSKSRIHSRVRKINSLSLTACLQTSTSDLSDDIDSTEPEVNNTYSSPNTDEVQTNLLTNNNPVNADPPVNSNSLENNQFVEEIRTISEDTQYGQDNNIDHIQEERVGQEMDLGEQFSVSLEDLFSITPPDIAIQEEIEQLPVSEMMDTSPATSTNCVRALDSDSDIEIIEDPYKDFKDLTRRTQASQPLRTGLKEEPSSSQNDRQNRLYSQPHFNTSCFDEEVIDLTLDQDQALFSRLAFLCAETTRCQFCRSRQASEKDVPIGFRFVKTISEINYQNRLIGLYPLIDRICGNSPVYWINIKLSRFTKNGSFRFVRGNPFEPGTDAIYKTATSHSAIKACACIKRRFCIAEI